MTYFGSVMVGRAKRQLSCFVITLSWSRALYLEFFFYQTTENFLRGHVRAFQDWSGAPRVILYDNLRSAVLERRGDQIHFNPQLLELAAHYHFAPRPCQVRAGNQKGRVERAIRYVRDSFWAGRVFTTLAECNRQALVWRAQQREEIRQRRRARVNWQPIAQQCIPGFQGIKDGPTRRTAIQTLRNSVYARLKRIEAKKLSRRSSHKQTPTGGINQMRTY